MVFSFSNMLSESSSLTHILSCLPLSTVYAADFSVGPISLIPSGSLRRLLHLCSNLSNAAGSQTVGLFFRNSTTLSTFLYKASYNIGYLLPHLFTFSLIFFAL